MSRIKPASAYSFFLKIILFSLIGTGILFGGLLFSNHLEQKRRKRVDENGLVVKAVVYDRSKTITGRSVSFEYDFKNAKYRNKEAGMNYYYQLNTGDSITVKIDSTDPRNSYILSPSR